MSGEQPVHRGNRHVRSEAARIAVLEAADNLLVELGFAKVTMEGIAARAGVSKPTVYRWWKSKTEILLDAFLQDVAEELVIGDTGSLVEDLTIQIDRLVHFLTVSDAGTVFRVLIAEAQHDRELLELLSDGFLKPQQLRDRLPFERAAIRGEIPPGADIDMLVEQVTAPIYYRALLQLDPVTPDHARHLLDRLISGLSGQS